MDKKSIIIIKIIITIMVLISLVTIGIYIVEAYVLNSVSYFTQHFTMFICLFCVGIIALMLPNVNQKKLSGDNKGDSLMLVVGVLLILCSFVSIIISYVQ